MSSSDSGSPTAARMLMSVQRFEGAGRFAISTAGGNGAAATGGGGRGRGAGLVAAAAGAGRGVAASAGLAVCASGDRQGVRHGLPWAAAGGAAPHSAITIAIGAMAENGEDRAW